MTGFYCDCRAGHQHDLDAQQHPFSLPELYSATNRDRCFPLPHERWPRPFIETDRPVNAADISSVDFAQLLSSVPDGDQPRSRLRLRTTTTLPTPLEDALHVTWDVDSMWLRLQELSDITVPIKLLYTAQRVANMKSVQYVPAFASDHRIDLDFHRCAHTVFAHTNISSCRARIYVFWPHLQAHNRTVVTDEVMGTWIDQVVIPAVAQLDSWAWQDHPKSWKDADMRARERREAQWESSSGAAIISHTLSSRFLTPLVTAMRMLTTNLPRTSPAYPFRDFSFVFTAHNLKRVFNADGLAAFDAFAQFQRTLSTLFRPEYLLSSSFLDRSFCDIGIEYNVTKQVTEPTTLLIRRTCLQHRFTHAL